MKRILCLLGLSFSLIAFGQSKGDENSKANRDEYKKYFKQVGGWIIDIRNATPKQLETLQQQERLKSIAHDRFGFSLGGVLAGTNQTLAVRFEQHTNAKVYEGNSLNWGDRNYNQNYIIDGGANIEFADVSISEETAKHFKYHVIANDSKEIVSWRSPTVFRKTTDGKSTYAYLGSYPHQANGFIRIEIYNTLDYSDRTAMMIDWRPVSQAQIKVGVEYYQKGFSGGPFYASLDHLKSEKYYNVIATTSLNDRKFLLSDSLVRLNINLKKTSFNYRAELIRNSNNTPDTIDLGNYNNSFFIYKEFWKVPGKYQLRLTPKLPAPGGSPAYYRTDKTLNYNFTVLPEKNPAKLFSVKELIISGILFAIIAAGIAGGILTFFKNIQTRKKIAEQAKQREIAQHQLSSVRSQLNPHFLFNALAGIQNLMNKNDNQNANRYLSKFARLTRNVLDSKELVGLKGERVVLDDYLQMEQFRFGFQYNIELSTDLDIENIEIPSMLLQPFVENAVKHGIAEKGKDGKIEISIAMLDSDLILKIKDNGQGFDVDKTYDGLGLALSKNRISLLNTIYKDSSFVLEILSDLGGTTVSLILKHWL